jgi:hypothetical protein
MILISMGGIPVCVVIDNQNKSMHIENVSCHLRTIEEYIAVNP